MRRSAGGVPTAWRENIFRILVVDDEESIRILYSEELAEEGYDVIATGDGSQVMALIEETRPDLVLLDIRPGQVNGLDVLRDIKNKYYDLPVVLCTVCPFFKSELRSIPADHYALKSSQLTDLKLKIRMAFQGVKGPLAVVPGGIDEMKPISMKQMEIPW
jgi:DNA-binding response OmpR family regulator